MRTITRAMRVVGITQDRAWKGEGDAITSSERLNIREDGGNAEMQLIADGDANGMFNVGEVVTVSVTADVNADP